MARAVQKKMREQASSSNPGNAADAKPARIDLGVWIELPPGARWSNEGMARLIGFMIEGAARHGGPKFHLMVPMGSGAAVKEDLQSLRAREDIDWVVHEPHLALRAAKAGEAELSPYGPTVRRFASMPPAQLGRVLSGYARAGLPFAFLRSLIRRRPLSLSQRLSFIRGLEQDPHSHLEAMAMALRGIPLPSTQRVARDLDAWRTERAADVSMPGAVQWGAGGLEEMAAYANRETPVQGWIVLHPFFRGAEKLQKPRAVIFPDAIPLTIPLLNSEHWAEGGAGLQWRRTTQSALAKADSIITFSRHVAARDLRMVWDGPASIVHTIPHAPPDVSDQLPFLDPGRREGDSRTRRYAADLLRAQATREASPYLRGFPFEEATYIALATQDRATKNIGLAAEAMHHLVRSMRRSIKLIMTARVNFGESWTRLPEIIEKYQLDREVCSFPDLPRPAHAALYHCAALAIHPAIFEGGHGPFPFYEALSVGCPCIMGRGPHTEELIKGEPELERYLFDPYDPRALAHLIDVTISDRARVLSHQSEILERLKQRTWADVACAYADAALGARTVSQIGGGLGAVHGPRVERPANR